MADPNEFQPLDSERAPSGEAPPAPAATVVLEGKAAEAREALWGMLSRMGIEASICVSEDDERIVLDVVGSEAGLVIGKKGQTLDALQYLVNKIVNRERESRKAIIVDSEGYRGRRADSLVELALRLGEKAVRTRRVITVNPMSPHDRRIIHLALDKVPGVTTRSEGEGSFRRLLIIPEPAKL
ncbi:MAG TPA: RNA-binding cell elongation regulator Jag/EloR [Polyangia bacterium]